MPNKALLFSLHLCSKCGMRMRLIRIVSVKAGEEIHTFICDACGHSETITARFNRPP